MSRMREHLLGYLLDALDPAERAALERDLEQDPQLRNDLAEMEATLIPLGFPDRADDISYEVPPAGLTARTCEFVEDSCENLQCKPQPASMTAMSQETYATSTGRGIRWPDVVVTVSVCLASAAVIFPALWTSWQQSHVFACQNNLRHLGLGIGKYADFQPDGRIPAVPLSGNRSTAGIYAALLQDRELLEDTRHLICPASDLAEHADTFRVPSLAQIDRATGEALVQLQRMLGGAYGFNLGYLEDGELKAPKHQGRAHYALMSDAPATYPLRKTKNHRGCGSNILYEDNHVRFVMNPCSDLADDPYLNRSGIVAAGLDCADVVLAESVAKPFVPSMLMP